MPLYQDFYRNDTYCLFWKFLEEDHFEIEELANDTKWIALKNASKKKQYEYLMVRQLLRKVGIHYKILYKENGAPYLYPLDWEISISHSFPFVFLAVSKRKIGVDIEKINAKISRLKYKFLNSNEQQWCFNKEDEIQYLTIIWCIKEALYKLHPNKYWSFSKNYEVQDFSLSDTSAILCKVSNQKEEQQYIAQAFKIENFWWVIVH